MIGIAMGRALSGVRVYITAKKMLPGMGEKTFVYLLEVVHFSLFHRCYHPENR